MIRLALVLVAIGLIGGVAYWVWGKPRGPDDDTIARAYGTPLAAPEGPLRVFHLGHSLVGRDMPAMLAQLSGSGHGYESQLGWGSPLKQHWDPDIPVNGFDVENAHDRYRDAREAVGSGDYDAVILTEMVEIRDAIRYFDSAEYLHRWAQLARDAAPGTRVYLYETWHELTDPEGWLNRLDLDLKRYWEGKLLFADLGRAGPDRPIYVIPAGQVFARFVRRIEERGGVGNIKTREDLFARTPEGELDPIHINDLGAYLVALTHYAVLYHRSPIGLPHQLRRADGTPANAPEAETALLMQRIVWDVVRTYPKTGVAP
ncbi:hypothetical protein [Thalassococcus sp. S3]|uniref:hypothetical protein n=1 Tax=Thalassococcus sp. S3 TaxID=2017482 RepID=UPI001583E0A4|nr:hypothetical protein [Thalassococcus sp. S3]